MNGVAWAVTVAVMFAMLFWPPPATIGDEPPRARRPPEAATGSW